MRLFSFDLKNNVLLMGSGFIYSKRSIMIIFCWFYWFFSFNEKVLRTVDNYENEK